MSPFKIPNWIIQNNSLRCKTISRVSICSKITLRRVSVNTLHHRPLNEHRRSRITRFNIVNSSSARRPKAAPERRHALMSFGDIKIGRLGRYNIILYLIHTPGGTRGVFLGWMGEGHSIHSHGPWLWFFFCFFYWKSKWKIDMPCIFFKSPPTETGARDATGRRDEGTHTRIIV